MFVHEFIGSRDRSCGRGALYWARRNVMWGGIMNVRRILVLLFVGAVNAHCGRCWSRSRRWLVGNLLAPLAGDLHLKISEILLLQPPGRDLSLQLHHSLLLSMKTLLQLIDVIEKESADDDS